MIEILSYDGAQLQSLPAKLAAILERQSGASAEVEASVRQILQQVRHRGDEAVVEYTAEFDAVSLTAGSLRVPQKALADARESMDPTLVEALEEAAANIRSFHERQRRETWYTEDGDGVVLGKKVIPLRRVGICVPGGQAPLISTMLMTAVPAQVAGVKQICVVTPPQRKGLPHPDVLGTAQLLGLEEVYGIGGAQAVGALAYGTRTISAVDKIVGPGSSYTVEAKRQVYGIVGIEMIPGPSEIVVLTDENANPRYIAADLLSQAEHGTGFEATVCITTSDRVATAVQREVEDQLQSLPRSAEIRGALDRYGAVFTVADLDAGVELVNRIAPEHVELHVENPWDTLDGIYNAGAVFLGEASTEPVGDYFAGTNHVLPTNGAARYASSLGLDDFVKTTSVLKYSSQRLRQVGQKIVRLARAEGFEAHAQAVQVRLDDDPATDETGR